MNTLNGDMREMGTPVTPTYIHALIQTHTPHTHTYTHTHGHGDPYTVDETGADMRVRRSHICKKR